ncbi:MAG: hypothetical protein AAFW98_15010 [Pseudomonadota bacterium]
MKAPDKGRDEMRNGTELRNRRREGKAPRAEVLSEMPMVAVLLVAAVIVALMAAGGPVIELLSGLQSIWTN